MRGREAREICRLVASIMSAGLEGLIAGIAMRGWRIRRWRGLPATQVCITCHSQMWTHAAMLAPVRQSWADQVPLQWTRVHDLPDYVYFDHSIHVAKGVGCSTCHGDVSEMPLVTRVVNLQMRWCLDCHREPEKHLRPAEAIFDPQWTEPADQLDAGRGSWWRCITCRRNSSRIVRFVTGEMAMDDHDDPVEPAPKRRRGLSLRARAEFAAGETEAALASFDRRTFLKLMAASVAAHGAGRVRPSRSRRRRLCPMRRSPEGDSGRAAVLCQQLADGPGGAGSGWVAGFGRGVVVEQHEGRPDENRGESAASVVAGGNGYFHAGGGAAVV